MISIRLDRRKFLGATDTGLMANMLSSFLDESCDGQEQVGAVVETAAGEGQRDVSQRNSLFQGNFLRRAAHGRDSVCTRQYRYS